MRKLRATALRIGPMLLLAACGGASSDQPAGTRPPTGRATSTTLSPTGPSDLPANATQADAVTYAWQQFVALNWPALALWMWGSKDDAF